MLDRLQYYISVIISRLLVVDLERDLKVHFPRSAGNYRELSRLAVKSSNRFFSRLVDIYIENKEVVDKYEVVNLEEFRDEFTNSSTEAELNQLFNSHGSDKGGRQSLERLYGRLFEYPDKVECVLEVGLGSRNKNIASHMILPSKPGGSLYAFRSFFSSARVYGLDIDKEILFADERIETLFGDQLSDQFPEEWANKRFDLMIDDGLHMPLANLYLLQFGVKLLKNGGFLVIEDVDENALDLWRCVALLFSASFACTLVNCGLAHAVVFQKL